MKDNNVYVNVYFRIEAGYKGGNGLTKEDTEKFFFEVKEILSKTGFIFEEKKLSYGCPEGKREGIESLYCHPQSLSGYIVKEKISLIEEVIKDAKTFNHYNTDIYNEVLNYSKDELLELLDNKKAELIDDIIEMFKTKRKNLFKEERAINNININISTIKEMDNIKTHYVYNLVEELIKEGKLEKAKIKYGYGYRSIMTKADKKNNVIPRGFKKIIARIKIDIGSSRAGDIIHIWKNEYNEYIQTDTQTEKNYLANLGMLRNSDLVEFIEIIK